MTPKAGRLAADLVLIALGVFGAVSGWTFGLWTGRTPGPGLLPFVVSVTLAVLATVSLAVDAAQPAGPPRPEDDEGPPTWGKFACYLGGLVFATFALEPLGYLPTVTLAFLFILKVAEGLTWTRTLVVTVATLIVCEILFVRALGVELPEGLLEGLL
jgi:hypothetical protein